jgi:uncharacterized protein (TIGR02231 family)
MRLLICLAAVVTAAAPLAAAELPATSKPDAVTVFPSGAEVRRVARVKIENGEHTVVINDLPQQAIANSIRVEGKATGKLEIGAVDSRRIVVPRGDAEAQRTERRRLEDEIERLKDERAGQEARIETAETQKELIKRLTELPTRPGSANGQGQAAPVREDWPQLIGLIGSGMTEVHRVVQDAQLRMRDIDRRIAELDKQLSGQAPAREERTEVRIHVRAQAALEADLVVRYQVANASWTPMYDARLASGAKNVSPQLTLTRRAAITQRTSEPWTDVHLTLSTTRPAGSVAAPELRPVTVDFLPERPPVVGNAAPSAAREMRTDQRAKVRDEAEGVLAAAPPAPVMAEPVAVQSANVNASDFHATYTVPGRVSIENTGEMKRVQIDETQLEPNLMVRAVPKREERAYLYAKLIMPKGSVFLPGRISLFRDQTFVGTGSLPQLSGGEEHELGFGADDSVRVRYSTEEKRGETGLISTSRTDQRNYRITVKNLHERPITYAIVDQVPTSLNQDIKVEPTGRVQPTRKDIDDKRGVLAWEDKLAPDEERVIEFGYRITWPAAKDIRFRN